jgi:ABC-type nitrate/sulfonate/bicarbonate transport system permease component
LNVFHALKTVLLPHAPYLHLYGVFDFMQLIRSQTSASQVEKSIKGKSVWRRIAPWYSILMVVAIWQCISFLELVPAFLIPSPVAVAQQFWEVIRNGTLLQHTAVTLSEVLPGLLIGVIVGVVLGYLIARIRLADELFSPLIVALQATPVVAYAPLLVIWFGSGTTSKVITCALIVFFPMLMNTVVDTLADVHQAGNSGGDACTPHRT